MYTTSATTQQSKTIKCRLLDVRSLSSKPVLVNELVLDHNIDLLSVTETWQLPDEYVSLNGLQIALDQGFVSVPILLDLSAAFNTTDHHILLQNLEQLIGIKGNS